MNFKAFLESENIPYLPFYYFISDVVKDDGSKQKKPIKEKNNLSVEEIQKELIVRKKMTKPKSYWVSENKDWKEIPLTKTELKSLVFSYTIFLKHHTEYYCIDIDDKTINSLDDYIFKLQENDIDENIIDCLRSCCWCKGNTKGIHIYIKCVNVPQYKNQQDVFYFLDGDFIKTNNMWEGVDKQIENYEPDTEPFDFSIIKPLFKSEQLNPKPKPKPEPINLITEKPKTEKAQKTKAKPEPKPVSAKGSTLKAELSEEPKPVSAKGSTLKAELSEEPKPEPKPDPIDIFENDEPLTEISTETRDYLTIMLNNKSFEKFNGYRNWLNIGILLKNEAGENGFDLFNKISLQMPKYDGESETKRFYNDLNKKIFTNDKKLTIGTIKKDFKDKDETLYKQTNEELKKSLKGSNETFVFDESKCFNFHTDYFNTLTKYAQKKAYFEIFVCKVLRPQPLYIYSENDDDKYNCLLYSESEIKECFKHLGSSIIKKTSKTDEGKETKFITEWIDDNNIKIYNKMDFIPYNGSRDITNKKISDTFNLFNGYNKHIHTEYDINQKEQILRPFKELLFEICGAEKQFFDYFYNFIAHLIQKPNERIPICFIFKSKEGVGKNLMLDVIGDLIGKAHYITSSKPNDFFGDYAEGFYRKLLVNINECEGKDTFDFEGKIKSFITENTITLNPKFVRQTTISNLARLIITTNKTNPIPIDVRSKDRRFCVAQATEKYLDSKYGTVFWTKLANYFKNPKFIACLYDDLNDIDLDGVKWKETRPITKAYLDMCRQYVPVEAVFLEDYIDNKQYNNFNHLDNFDDDFVDKYEDKLDVNTTVLYKWYTDFCKKYGYINDKTYQPNITKFSARIQELDLGIIKQKTSINTVFRFTPKEIYKNMEKKNWIIKKENEIDEEDLKDIGGEEFEDYFLDL